MKKDIALKQLQEYPDIAADIINAIVYEGDSVVVASNLELKKGESYISNSKGSMRERRRDILFFDKTYGSKGLYYGIENQSDVDNTMPLRTMEYDGARYRTQVREYTDKNRKKGRANPIRRLRRDQKVTPVLTLVLYYGKKWRGPKSLSDMTYLEGYEDLQKYFPEYHMNLIELGADKEFYKRFRSDFRLVVRYIAIKDDKKALEKFFQNDDMEICHVEEILDIMSAFEGEKGYEKIKETILNREKKEAVTMGTYSQELVKRSIKQGMERGMEQSIVNNIRAFKKTGFQEDMILDLLKESYQQYDEEYLRNCLLQV